MRGNQDSAVKTLGDDAGMAAAMTQLGRPFKCTTNAREIIIDQACKLITTPADMFDDASLADVTTGIRACVAAVLQ